MTGEPEWLDDLADAVGDGRPVDWAAASERATDEAERSVLHHLESISWVRRAFSDLAGRERGDVPASLRPFAPSIEREASPPTLVGGYSIGSLVGEGPLGSVYLAGRPECGRPPVALKLIRWQLDSARILERFEALRGTLAPLSGFGVVPTLDAAESDEGRVYFVHEFVDGPSILEHCRALGPGLSRRLELFAATCDLVQKIHGAGLRHGALKPGNLLVERKEDDARPRIIDLEVAEALNQRATERALFRDFGRPFRDLCYFSPEETGGGGDPPDARSDIFSLGVLLYELVAGRTPFGPRIAPRADVAEYLRRIREDAPAPPTADVSDPPAPRQAAMLDRIVLRALEKERSRRQRTAAELAADVRCLIDELSEGLG